MPFLNPAWTSGGSRFMYCWSLAWRILSITLLACEMSPIVWQFEHSLDWKLTFSSTVATAEFSKFAGILSATLSQHSLLRFEITQPEFHHLNYFFVVMLPKAHLTSHSWMYGSRWMITPSWSSGSLKSFLYSSVYYCHLLWISSAFFTSISFLSFIPTIVPWNVTLVSLVHSGWLQMNLNFFFETMRLAESM